MKILAIETSHEIGSVALLLGEQLWSRQLDGANQHSAHALDAVAALLAEAELSLSALDAIAFGAGPGAFTGVRLACGLAQGLALGAELGIVPVGSLNAIAAQVSAPQVLVATDARMGEIYAAHFACSTGAAPLALDEVRCLAPAEFEARAGEWLGLGSGFAVHEAALGQRLGTQLSQVQAERHARAEEVARLAACEAEAGRLLAPEQALPLYVRNKVALTLAERQASGVSR